MIVAIDTSSAITTIGAGDGSGPRAGARAEGARRHAEEIDTLFADFLAPVLADAPPVEAVVVGIGPGPYSGLRVGIAFGIGLARAWSVPIVGVCSLDARAWQIARTMNEPAGAEFTIATDARRREHYVARYRIDNANNAIVRVVGPMVSANSLPEAAHRDVEIDPAWLAAHVAGFIDQGCTPQPVEPVLVEHGGDASSFSLEQGPLFTPTPLYLRKPDATIAGSLPV